jgi:glutamine amidotransferase
MITIVDYGLGNLGSIRNMYKRLGVPAVITSDPSEISCATKLILPGVGAFDNAMSRLSGGALRSILDRKAMEECIPILGICLGMQLLTRSSEEGQLPGLGWIAAETKRFPRNDRLKVPHMGWNVVTRARDSALTKDMAGEIRFYFVHSYCVHVDNEEDSILKAQYGITFDAGVQHGNIYGAQFHPEKSHRFGMQLLKNFSEI